MDLPDTLTDDYFPPECARCGKDIVDDDFMRNSLGDILCWECYGKLIDTAEARREG